MDNIHSSHFLLCLLLTNAKIQFIRRKTFKMKHFNVSSSNIKAIVSDK